MTHKLRTPRPRAPRPPLQSFRVEVTYRTATRDGSVVMDVTAPAGQVDAAMNKAMARARLRNPRAKITGARTVGRPIDVTIKRN